MKKHFLFVGNSNIRGGEIVELLEDSEEIEARSAAFFPLTGTPITLESIRWANKIFVINEKEDLHKTQLLQRFPNAEEKEIIDLNLYQIDIKSKEFEKIVREKLEKHL